MVKLPSFDELPYGVKKSPRARWNYLADKLNDGSEEVVSSEPDATTRTINITVNDGEDPIKGASVVIDEILKITGSAGGCKFTDCITDGPVTVKVSAIGFVTKTEEIIVSEKDTNFTISLTKE